MKNLVKFALLITLSTTAFSQTAFVAGNNKGADDLRKELRKGKTCLTLVDQPAAAELTITVASSALEGRGMSITKLPEVSMQVTDRSGRLLFSASGMALKTYQMKKAICEGKQ